MRRSRRLTHSERWDLGLLLALFMAGLLVLAVLWRTHAVSNLMAMAFGSNTPAVAADRQTDPAPADDLNRPSFQSMPDPIFLPDAPDPAPLSSPSAPRPIETRWYNGKQYKFVKTLRMTVTAYSPDSRCCWPYDGTTTASGASVKTNAGKLVAADTSVIPFHDLVSIPGYNGGQTVPVLDRGGAIKGARLDVLLPTFEQAKAWGTRTIDVKIFAPM